ncbi:hypothetical protein CPZ30_25135 [Paenibacillus lautus]|nr:hypothetical protein CPZ30_25135 [Paenibacillus lautus]
MAKKFLIFAWFMHMINVITCVHCRVLISIGYGSNHKETAGLQLFLNRNEPSGQMMKRALIRALLFFWMQFHRMLTCVPYCIYKE